MQNITLLELLKYFLTVGATAFGGPLAIIDRIRYDLVLKKNWLQMEEFKNIFGYAQIAPGPLAFQVSVYVGYYKKGFWGAVASGFGVVFPSFILVLVFSIFYKEFRDIEYVRYALYGLSPVIVAIIAKSGLNLSKNIFQKDVFLYVLFFLSIFLTIAVKIQIIYIIISFAILSLAYYSLRGKIKVNRVKSFTGMLFLAIYVILVLINTISIFIKNFLLFLANFVKNSLSFVEAGFAFLSSSALLTLALLFLKVGSLTYGSGFVIVGVLRQEVVDNFHWLSSKEFIDGIAFGQITPGPVVITSTFIGYMTSGFTGSIISTVCIFLPTFIFVMILAQKIHKYKDNFYLQSLIKGANAAALGAILSTAFILSKDALIDVTTIAFFLIAVIILFLTKFKDIYLILLASLAGILIKVFFHF